MTYMSYKTGLIPAACIEKGRSCDVLIGYDSFDSLHWHYSHARQGQGKRLQDCLLCPVL